MFSSRLATFWGALRTSFLGDTARLEPRRNILLVLVLVLSRGLRSRRDALAEFSRARVFCGHAAARRFCSGLKAACARPRGEKLLLAGDTQNVFHAATRGALACVRSRDDWRPRNSATVTYLLARRSVFRDGYKQSSMALALR